MKKSKFKIKYSEFVKTKEIEKLFDKYAELIKINHLKEVGLISKGEYDKIREQIGFVASL